MNLNKLKEKLIKEDKEFKEEYYKEDLAFGIARLVSNARAYKKIDQTKLAKLIKTKQSGISRLERGNSLPSLTLVQKIAKSLDFRMKISFISNKTGSVLDSDGIISTNDHNWGFSAGGHIENNSSSQTIIKKIPSPYSYSLKALV